MALPQHSGRRAVHGALVETARSLLVAARDACNDAMNQVIFGGAVLLRPGAPKTAEKKGSGRYDRGYLCASAQRFGSSWLKNSAPHLKCPAPFYFDRCTMKQAAAAHRKSGAQCLRMLTDALSVVAESPRDEIRARQLGADLAGWWHDVCILVLG